MKIVVEKQPKSGVKLSIEVSPEKLAQYKKVVMQKLNEEMDVPGFRAGKIPENVIEEKIGKEALQARLIQEALPLTYTEAVVKEKVQVVSRPQVKIISEDPLKYEAVVSVLPEIKLPDLKKIKVPKEDVKMTEKEVEQVLLDLRKRASKFKEVTRALKKGDRAEIDFEGFDDKGKALPSTKSQNHPVILGEQSLVPGFEENIEGMKKGEEKEFKVKFPKDYPHKPFQNKDVKFKVKVNRTEEVEMPELDEAFIQQISGKKQSLADFKKQLEGDLLVYKKRDVENRRREEFLSKLVEAAKLEVPEGLIKEEIDFMSEETKLNLKKQGIDFKVYEEQMKKQGKDLDKQYAKEAEKRVRVRLVLSQSLKDEKIEVEEAELDKAIEARLKNIPDQERERQTKVFEKGSDAYRQLQNRLALNKLFDLYL